MKKYLNFLFVLLLFNLKKLLFTNKILSTFYSIFFIFYIKFFLVILPMKNYFHWFLDDFQKYWEKKKSQLYY